MLLSVLFNGHTNGPSAREGLTYLSSDHTFTPWEASIRMAGIPMNYYSTLHPQTASHTVIDGAGYSGNGHLQAKGSTQLMKTYLQVAASVLGYFYSSQSLHSAETAPGLYFLCSQAWHSEESRAPPACDQPASATPSTQVVLTPYLSSTFHPCWIDVTYHLEEQ